ncbi:replication protein [Neobacillus drentensis]|uniref:replication protein n=1 Tax=Neobacillus drentensis TaxID=220684 RepID=UPI002FFE12A4
MKASHKERKVLVDKQEVFLTVGEFVTGRFSLHKEFNEGIPPRKQTKDTTLWSWLKKLEKMGSIDIKTHNKYSVISILHWSDYQGTLTTESQQIDNGLTRESQQNDNKMTTESQQIDTNNNVNNEKNEENEKNGKKPSSPKQVYDEQSVHYQLALRLYQNILANNQDYKKPNLQKWANDVRLMIEQDKRTEEQISYLMDWVQQDSFWKSNILSPSKLREKFDQLVIRVKENIHKQNKSSEKEVPRAYQSLQDWADEDEPERNY